MSPGSAPILLLKAAPEPEQLADRLDGGPWQGLEVPLMPAHVADDAAIERAIANVRAAAPGAVTAEAPVAWPSGAHVRVDRLDDEARAGIERSGDGFHLVFGETEGEVRWRSTATGRQRMDELLTIAVAYFQEALQPPSANLEATQADLGDLLRWMAAVETYASR